MPSRLRLGWSFATLLAVAPGAALADPPAAATAPAAVATAPAAGPAATPAAPAAKPAASPAPAKPAAPAKPRAYGKKKKPDAPITGGPIATYPAFRMLDGGASRVSVMLSKKVGVTEQKAEGKLSYRIAGMQVPTRTNRLPLVTTFFATPVARAELVQHDGDVDLVIDLRSAATAQFRIVESDKGAELQVDFPKAAEGSAEAGGATGTAPSSGPVSTKSLEPQTNGAY